MRIGERDVSAVTAMARRSSSVAVGSRGGGVDGLAEGKRNRATEGEGRCEGREVEVESDIRERRSEGRDKILGVRECRGEERNAATGSCSKPLVSDITRRRRDVHLRNWISPSVSSPRRSEQM